VSLSSYQRLYVARSDLLSSTPSCHLDSLQHVKLLSCVLYINEMKNMRTARGGRKAAVDNEASKNNDSSSNLSSGLSLLARNKKAIN